MNIDKTVRATMIITNIIIWSLISIILFFFGIIYVNAYDFINDYGSNAQCNGLANGDIYCNGTGNRTLRTTIEYNTKKNGNYHLKLKTHIDMEITRNEYEQQNVIDNTSELISQVLDMNIIEINLGQYWYDNRTQYFSNIRAGYNWVYIKNAPPEISEQYKKYYLRVFINFEADINVPSGYTNNATRFNTFLVRSDREYIGAYIDNFSLEYTGDNTEALIKQSNENTSWIGNLTDSILSKTQQLNEWLENQYYLQQNMNNSIIQGQQNIFDLVEGAIFGDYTINDINGNPQFTTMVSGENRMFAKLGGDPSFNQTFDNTQFKGGNFIWGMINRLINNYAWLSAIIVLGISLKIISQALGRK